MTSMIIMNCFTKLHYRQGYIDLLEKIYKEYNFSDGIDKSFFEFIPPDEEIIMNDDVEGLLNYMNNGTYDLTTLLEKCCLRGAINCFKLLKDDFNVEITKKCLDNSFKGGNQYIINECLKEQNPDKETMEAAIQSHNIDNFKKLFFETNIQIRIKCMVKYKNLHAFIYYLNRTNDLDTCFLFSPYFNVPSFCEYLYANGANMSSMSTDGDSTLDIAVLTNHTETASFLISKGIEMDEKAFYYAVSSNSTVMVELLVSHGADVNFREKNTGFSMLHIACLNDNIKAVEILISHGININDNENDKGLTPLMIVSILNYKEIAEFLLSHGASINMQDKNGEIALHHAIMHDCKEFTEFIANKIEFLAYHDRYQVVLGEFGNFSDLIEILVSNGAYVNAKNKDLHSPLHLAAFTFDCKIAEILISHGAIVNSLNIYGVTPLDFVIFRIKSKDGNDPDVLEELNKVRRCLISHGGKTSLQMKKKM